MEFNQSEVKSLGRDALGDSSAGASRTKASALVLLFLLSGCATTGDLLPGGTAPPVGKVAQISPVWHNEIIRSPDPANSGAMTPGIVGKVYLFDPKLGQPIAANGQLVVDLYDPSQKGTDAKPMAQWTITKDALASRLQHDAMIGWGYVMLLPWPDYKADMKEVVLKVHYEEPKALPIYSEPTKITFNPVMDLQSSHSTRPVLPGEHSTLVPAGNQVPAGNR